MTPRPALRVDYVTAHVFHTCGLCGAVIQLGETYARHDRFVTTPRGPRRIIKCWRCDPTINHHEHEDGDE